MTATQFVDQLSSIELPNVFNPYREVCAVADHSDSPAIRRQNLAHFLGAVETVGVHSIWLGRDLGYRGGRRTGIPLTDEFHLQLLAETYCIDGIAKATNGMDLQKERTATEVWKILSIIRQPIVLWNAFPFHPFEDNQPLTNRPHSVKEFELCHDILISLIEWLQPGVIITLGADAERAVTRLGLSCERVRHPSYGGHVQFARQMFTLYQTSDPMK